LYADENFPLPVVQELRRLGHDVLTAHEAGQAQQGIPDEDVLSFATSQGRAVLTINRRHFFRLHVTHPAHADIIACTADRDFPGQAERIQAALLQRSDIAGMLIRIYQPPKSSKP
jgi:hypothetical protein